MNDRTPASVVYTNKARCRDCYRCVRVCPVKAIRMREGQACEVAESCLACGTCIRECPQGAKSFRNDLDRVMALVAEPGLTAVSIAPSFAALFPEWERRRLPSALRRLGFGFVAETAVGAYAVARATAAHAAGQPGQAHIVSACPAVVRYVERYRPALVEALVPVASPMAAHARHLKQRMPGARVVFVGPCVAKKMEAERPGVREWVDAVLTFVELREWFRRAGLDLNACEESGFDEAPAGASRLFPLVGGSLRTASLDTDVLAPRVVSVSGFEEVRDMFDGVEAGETVVVEPLFCRQGCINGPAMPAANNVFRRREALLDYAATTAAGVAEQGPDDLGAAFVGHEVSRDAALPDEADIMRELERSGKSSPEDQLNCGACGYASCRDKAVAVLRGMAETEMCIPLMRRRAEQRTDRIIETSPNGIVILDERLAIVSMNPAFRRYFMCSEAVCGKRISYLMDPHLFEQVAAGGSDLAETVVRHDTYNLVCHQIAYALRGEKQYVGIFVNITHSRASQEKLNDLRARTLTQAQQLLEHQVSMAQKITQFLGESAAQGEVLVEHLREMACDDGGKEPRSGGKAWPRDTYTLKP